MSVLSRPRLPHPTRHADHPTTLPTQRGTDGLQPWSPTGRRPQPSAPTVGDRRRRAALALAGLAVVGAGAAGLVVAAPWEDDPVPAPAPAITTTDVTTTDQLRDGSLAGRGPAAAGGTTTDQLRDRAQEQRGGLFP